jgi:hypothetical protein
VDALDHDNEHFLFGPATLRPPPVHRDRLVPGPSLAAPPIHNDRDVLTPFERLGCQFREIGVAPRDDE